MLQKDSTDILLFGGEYYDGKNDKMRVYNDIYVYHPDKNTWTRIISPNGYAVFLCNELYCAAIPDPVVYAAVKPMDKRIEQLWYAVGLSQMHKLKVRTS